MGEGKGQEDTPRQAKEIIMWGPSVGVILFGGQLAERRSANWSEAILIPWLEAN